MANIKSAKKRILVNQAKADRNKAVRSGVKTAIKKVYAGSKGVYHKNNVAHKVSRIAKAVNEMA